MTTLKEILASVIPGNSFSAQQALDRINKVDPVLADVIETSLNKQTRKVQELTNTLNRLYTKLDSDLPKIVHDLETTIIDGTSALNAYEQCGSEWFKDLYYSPSAISRVAQTLVLLCKPFKCVNPLWELLASNDPETLNEITRG